MGHAGEAAPTAGVDAVSTDLGVGRHRLAIDHDDRFVEGTPRLHGWAPAGGVGAFLVVDVDEPIDLVLELGEGGAGRLLAQPLLEREVIALDLSLGLRTIVSTIVSTFLGTGHFPSRQIGVRQTAGSRQSGRNPFVGAPG